jgi:hypothetical protein
VEIAGLTACRRFFLDASLLMRGHPQDDLLLAWAGLLQQQQEDRGEQRPASPAQLQRMASALWTSCAGATLLSCYTPLRARYSRCTSGCSMLELLRPSMYEIE